MSALWIIIVLVIVAVLVNVKMSKELVIGAMATIGVAGLFFSKYVGDTSTPSFEVRTTLPDF
jgi:hypothetical protein